MKASSTLELDSDGSCTTHTSSESPTRIGKLRELTLQASSMITIIGTTAIAASLPDMSAAYASAPNGAFFVKVSLTLPALTVGLFAPLMGRIVDRFGRKPLFVAAMILYAFSGTAGFYLSSLEAILASRLLLGISVAGVLTCATALLADYAAEGELGRLMGRQSLFMGIANVVFLSLGGILAEHNWRWPFMIYAISLVILPGVVLLIAEPSISIASRLEQKGKAERLPWAKTAFIYLVAFVNMVVYFMVPVYLPFYLRSFSKNSAVAGVLLSVVGLMWGIASFQYAGLRTKLNFEQILMSAFGLMGAAFVSLAFVGGYFMVVLSLVLIGVGLGVLIPNLNAWLLSFVPPAAKGRAIGGLLFFVFLGQFFSPIITRPVTEGLGIARAYWIAGSLLLVMSLGCAVRTALQAGSREPIAMRR